MTIISNRTDMDTSIALRCVLQRRPRSCQAFVDSGDADAAAAAAALASGAQKFAMIPSSVRVANLLELVLRQLDVSESAADCTAQVVLPGWRTLSLGEICNDPKSATVHSLLGNVSNIAVLLIQLPPAPMKPLSPAAVNHLLRSLLPRHTKNPHVQVAWLKQSGCPLEEPDLLSYLASPGDFAFSDKARVDLAEWRRRLRRLSSSAQARRRRASATTVEASDEADSMEATGRATTDDWPDVDASGVEKIVIASDADDDDCANDNDEDDEGYREHRRSIEAALMRLSVLARAPRRHPHVQQQQQQQQQLDKENRCHGDADLPPPAPPPLPLHRSRLFIDPHTEIPHLERHFAAKPHPAGADCRQIAAELNAMPFRRSERRLVQAKNVRLWFKNRRARARKVDPTPSPPSSSALSSPQPQMQMHLPILHAPAAADSSN